jgi:hypothetical protein
MVHTNLLLLLFSAMPVVKVWNEDRTVKKTVMAFSLGELTTKGVEKLGLSEMCKVRLAVKLPYGA